MAESPSTPHDPAGRELADWTVRAVATSLDVVVLTVAQGVLRTVGFSPVGLFVCDWVLVFGYLSVGAWLGATLGNVATRTRVVDERGGGRLSFLHAARRTLCLLGLLVTLIGAVVDVMVPHLDSRRQTLHDKAGHSLVIRSGRFFRAPDQVGGTVHGS
jgi:uncharacterized RDD family membrane protein YckC